VPPDSAAVTAIDTAKPDLVPLDKWRHFLAYACLGSGFAYATADAKSDQRFLAIGVISATILYGVGIEVWQLFLPDRYFSLGDAYANAIGGICVTVWYLLRPSVRFVPVGEWLQEFYAQAQL
jgi:VanZ family protein